MALLYKNPGIAKLVNKQAPYRGQWVIYHHPNHQYRACHEVEQMQGECKVVEHVQLNSLADAQAFSTYLSSYGWSRINTP